MHVDWNVIKINKKPIVVIVFFLGLRNIVKRRSHKEKVKARHFVVSRQKRGE